MNNQSNLKFLVCDIGKKQVIAYNPQTKTHHEISTDDFKLLNVPGLFDGMTIIIEDAHLRAREENSKAQTYNIDELRQIRKIADQRNISILCFPQKVTPKTRKIYSILETDDKKLIHKTDENDTLSIAYYIEKFPHVIDSLKEFHPTTGKKHEEKNLSIFDDRSNLTEDSNLGRNRNYGLSDKDNDDAVSEWIRNYVSVLYSNLPQSARDYFELTLNNQNDKIVEKSTNLEDVFNDIDVFSSDEKNTNTSRLSASTIEQLFKDTNYDLKTVKKTKLVNIGNNLDHLPIEMKSIENVKKRKNLFIQIVLPLIIEENTKIKIG